MNLTQEQQELRERLLIALLEAVIPLKRGPDPELALELLIQAADMLKQHLEKELEELRAEQVD
jgi:hypothetical protein